MALPQRIGSATVSVFLTTCTAVTACAGSSTPARSELEPEIGRSQPPPASSEPREAAAPSDDPPEAAAPGDDEASKPAEPSPDAPPEDRVVPAPEDRRVCEHVVAVVVSEAEEPEGFSDGAIEDLVDACAVELARKHLAIGDEAFDRRAACVLSAQTAAQMHACDPEPTPQPKPEPESR